MHTTDLRYCIAIPVYRQVTALRDFLPQVLEAIELPVVLLDDGNTEEDARELEKLAQHPMVSLLRHEQNCGKGAAVQHIAEYAAQQGFSHLVQIDADGQHTAKDLPKFVQASEQHPEALILGAPVFDDSAPAARVWGRKLTTGMIALQTWSTSVEDGLFGFRCYPLAALTRAFTETHIHPRMGFDVEVLVRMLWNGASVKTLRTTVQYPPDGVSNFSYLEDNLSLILLHTRLVLLGLWRGPVSLLRRMRGVAVGDKGSSAERKSAWHEKKEHGSRLALQALLWLYKLGGRALLEVLLYPVIFYFWIKDPEARRNSKKYLFRLAQCYPEVTIPSRAPTYWHFHRFGQKIISSLQAWMGEYDGLDIDWHGREMIFELIDRGQGGIVLSAHIGCLEVCRATHKQQEGLAITPLMYLENARVFRNFLAEINPESTCTVLPIESLNAGVAMAIQKRIAQGEFFAILADRQAPGTPGRSLEVPFLNHPSRLPEGAFALAMALECPTFTFFTIYNEEKKCYQAFWEKLVIQRPQGRKERRACLQELAEEFARRMERMCRKAPLQWFNFFDFWHR